MPTDEEKPSGFIRKTWSFDPGLFEKFQTLISEMGGSPQTLFRKVMTDYLTKRYINFDAFDDDIKQRIYEKAHAARKQNIPGSDNLQTIVSLALREWLAKYPSKK